MEQWKDIVVVKNGITYDFTGIYQVSNLGRVRSVDRNIKSKDGRIYSFNGKIIKQSTHANKPYLTVRLCNNGKGATFDVHRLVAQAFIPNPENKETVDHIDTDTTNNKVENLRWFTPKEQLNDNELTKERHRNSLGKKIICTTTNKEFDTVREAANYYGCNDSNIIKCCKGSRKTHGILPDGTKLEWKYK